MKNLTIIIILLFISLSSQAETITGSVFSIKTKEAIIGANIILYSADNKKPIQSSQTDKNGNFTINSDSIKNCILNITIIGYTPANIIVNSHNNVNLGIIELENNSLMLNEVEVIGDNIIQKVDKYVIIPTDSELKRSRDLFNLLKNLYLPGLEIDNIKNTASINGNTPIYQINGIPKNKEDILSINPQNIVRIDYSNTPSIRYINDNVGGIINFIIKERETGGSLYTNLYASPSTGLISGYIGGKINYKKSEFSISVAEDWRKTSDTKINATENYIGREYPINDISMAKPKVNKLSNFINLSYLYQYNTNTVFSIAFLNRISNNKNTTHTNTEREYNNQPFILNNNNNSVTDSYTQSLDIFFKKEMKRNQSIELNIVGTLFNSDYNRKLIQTINSQENIYINDIDNKRWSLITELAYHKSFSKISTNWGIKNKFSHTQNIYTPDNTTSKLKINDNYFYGEIIGSIKKVSYSLGTGLKTYYEQNDNMSRVYLRNLSTLKILYSCKKNLTFDYLFMYNPNLPSVSQLENVYQVVNDIMAKEGNPNLKPSEWMRNRILISYKWSKYRARLWGIYDYTFSPLISDIYYDKTKNYFVSKTINAEYNTKFNLQLDLSANELFNHLNLSTSVGWDYIKSRASNFNHTLSNIYWNLDALAYYKSWSLSVNLTLRPQKELIGEAIVTPSKSINVSLQYSFKDFIFSASIYNPFFNNKYIDTTQNFSKVHPMYVEINNNDYANMVAIGIVYKINFGKQFKRTKKNLNNSDKNDSMIIAE